MRRRSRKGKVRILDLKGQRFGRLLVIEQTSKRSNGAVIWKCICDCGNETFVSSNNLRRPKTFTRSCGCLMREGRVRAGKRRALNLKGERFGRLIVIKRLQKKRRGLILWECKCDCGNIVETTTQNLRSGDTKSCGCFHSDVTIARNKVCALPEGQASRNMLRTSYKNVAKQRGLVWDITDELFDVLTQGNCFYCGKEPSQVIHAPHCKGAYIYNGIDRLNSDEGYNKSNCVPACKDCNYAKRKMTLGEFTSWLTKAYKNIETRLAPGYAGG